MTKRRGANRPRPADRFALAALNDLLQIVNRVLPEAQRVPRIETAADLLAFRGRVRSLTTLGAGAAASDDSPLAGGQDRAHLDRALAAISTNAWRAKRKTLDPKTREPSLEMKRVNRDVMAILDALEQLGVEVVEMQGLPYDSGMAVRVVGFEPTLGISAEEITETIKPSVRWHGRQLQMGEVIVGTPHNAESRKDAGQ